jgi:phosphoribosyl-AMP cyclohydrolase
VIAQDAASGAVLMLAWMNADALQATLLSGQAVYWSRSRGALWRKGETSGHTQRVIDLRIDCDQDAILLLVEQAGPACHTGAPNCFYRSINTDGRLERTPR